MITNASFRTKKLPGMCAVVSIYCTYIYYKMLVILQRDQNNKKLEMKQECEDDM